MEHREELAVPDHQTTSNYFMTPVPLGGVLDNFKNQSHPEDPATRGSVI